jgi:hypothetical protein
LTFQFLSAITINKSIFIGGEPYLFNIDSANAFFDIPEELIGKTPCQASPILYEDPALEIDLDDAEWLTLSGREQHAKLEAKKRAEENAIAACNTCPLIEACQAWAMDVGDGVFGVVGGTTLEQRIGIATTKIPVDTRLRGPLGQVRDDLIEEWTNEGVSNRVIAQRLGCNIRTVERRKAKLAAGTAKRFDGSQKALENQLDNNAILPVGVSFGGSAIQDMVTSETQLTSLENRLDIASNSLVPSRVSAETAVIFDLLIDGGLRDRNAVINAVIPTISKQVALDSAPEGRVYEDEAAKIAVGARKFVMNRIDIAVRRGRIVNMKTESGKILICLEKSVANIWRSYRATASSEIV